MESRVCVREEMKGCYFALFQECGMSEKKINFIQGDAMVLIIPVSFIGTRPKVNKEYKQMSWHQCMVSFCVYMFVFPACYSLHHRCSVTELLKCFIFSITNFLARIHWGNIFLVIFLQMKWFG